MTLSSLEKQQLCLEDPRTFTERVFNVSSCGHNPGEQTAKSTAQHIQSRELHLLGINYKSSPIKVRERFSFLAPELDTALNSFNEQIGPTVILSTCNRTEFYISSNLAPGELTRKVYRIITSLKGLDENLIAEHATYFYSSKAVEHLFRVTSGLESMIVGEGQILNQVKTAYRQASYLTDALLNQLFQRALATGKRVRSETNIAKGAMSVPAAALQIIQNKLSPSELADQNIMILGSGQVAKLCLEHLHLQGASKNITLVQRSESHLLSLTQYGINQSINYSQLFDAIKAQDVVLVCTSAPHYVLQPCHLLDLQHPLIVADMSVPRNVSPEISSIAGVELIDLDYLQGTVQQNLYTRAAETDRATDLLKEEIHKFEQWKSQREHLSSLATFK